MVNDENNEKAYDSSRIEALEETVYATAHALETFLELMIEKGFITEKELLQKMDDLAEHEDVEELGYDADAPRDNLD